MIDDYGGGAAMLERTPNARCQFRLEKPADAGRSDEGEETDFVAGDEKLSDSIVADAYLAPTLR